MLGLQQQQSYSSHELFSIKVNVTNARGGLVVGHPTAVREDPGRISPRPVVFITTVTAIYSLGHRLCTLIAVLRSTQPSTLRGMVK